LSDINLTLTQEKMTMIKYLLFMFILLTVAFFTVPSIAENEDTKEKVYYLNQVDKKPSVKKGFKPLIPLELSASHKGDPDDEVILSFILTSEGKVKDPEVFESDFPEAFNKYALEGIKDFSFRPAEKDGVPVDCYMRMPIRFELTKSIYEVEEVDRAPYVLKRVDAVFPSHLRDSEGALYEGIVEIRFIVTKEGEVKNPEVINSIPKDVFDKYALDAIKKYSFEPAKKNNNPVECYFSYSMEFNLVGEGEIVTLYDYYQANDKGNNYLKAGEYNKAIEAFNEAIRIYRKVSLDNSSINKRFTKKSSSGYTGRGIAYMSLGKYEDALSDFTRAIDIDPKEGLNYKLRGQVNHIMRNLENALEDYSNALEKYPEFKDVYFKRGEVLRELGRYNEAIDDYTREISINESNVQAYNNRAFSYNKLKDLNNMCIDLIKACKMGDCRGLELSKKAGKCPDNME
jgi:TonB family protein